MIWEIDLLNYNTMIFDLNNDPKDLVSYEISWTGDETKLTLVLKIF